MDLFFTKDRRHYRRWINIFPGLLISGAAQFLSGRKKAGLIWFGGACILAAATVRMFFSSYGSNTPLWLNVTDMTFSIGMTVDACRCPIPCIGPKGWGKFIGLFLVISLLPALLIRTFLFHPFTIPTHAMEPTLMGVAKDAQGNNLPGDYILVSKIAYWSNDPQRGDIVVFKTSGIDHPSVRKNTYYVKRIVGIPGETLSIDPPHVLVNHEQITTPEIITEISEGLNGYHGYQLAHATATDAILVSPSNSIALGKNEYLVLGDNSKISLDGRYFGPIQRSSIVGQVTRICAPAQRKRTFK